MLGLLSSGTRIINVDESWVAEAEYSRRMWCPTKAPATISFKSVNPRLSLLAALDNDGNVYFTLSHSITDSDIIAIFLKGLCEKLDVVDPNWRNNSVMLFDNAKYHTG